MKERPILYSTPMVLAKLEGRKTMTRRIVTKNNSDTTGIWDKLDFGNAYADHLGELKYLKVPQPIDETRHRVCPKWMVGDLLWCRETWCYAEDETGNHSETSKGDFIGRFLYKSMGDNPHGNWKPSIFMPKEAARIWEEITDVRVERLQDISEEDAIKEGIYDTRPFGFRFDGICQFSNPIAAYQFLWQQINGAESWDQNPWVWVIETKILSTTGKPEVKFASL